MNHEISKVLLTTSLVVDVPKDEDGSSDHMESICDRLRDIVAFAFKDDPSVSAVGTIGYDWFSDDSTNVAKCIDCGDWVTNREKPNALQGLPTATIVDGNVICDQCHRVR